jgi:hypothetical protein
MKLKLKSANDVRDLLFSLKEEEKNHKEKHQSKGKGETPYSHITASTREVDYYTTYMKGLDSDTRAMSLVTLS